MHGRLSGRWLLSSVILVAACVAGDKSLPLAPNFDISDGAHSGGTPGFYFLPPMVPNPTTSGVLDPDIARVNPAIVICDVTAGPDVDCGGSNPALRAFSISSVPPIVLDGEKYKVNWDTKEATFTVGHTYRIHVLAGSGPNRRELGFADVLLTTEPGKAKHLASGETIALNDGRTLPIQLRIETGVIVPPGPAAALALTGLPATIVAGTSASVTVTARDLIGQVAIGYRGTVTFTSSDPQAVLPADYGFTDADAGTHTFSDLVLRTAGDVTVTVTDTEVATVTGTRTTTVAAGVAASFAVDGLTDGAPAGSAQRVTVTARDADGNVATGYTGTIAFTATDPVASLPDVYTFTGADAGTHEFSGAVVLRTAGTTTVTATDQAMPAITGAQTVDVAPAAATVLALSGVPASAVAGTAFDVTVTAKDAFGNIATGYGATVQFSSSDPAAQLPAPYAFQPGDAGTHPFGGVVLGTAGARVLQASDGTLGVDATVLVEPGTAATLRFTTQPRDAEAGEAISPPVVVTAYDVFDNIATGFAGPVTVALGANPGSGTLSGTLSVSALLGVATFAELRVSTGGNGYTIVASAGGLPQATSDAFDVAFPGMVVVSPGRAHACALDQNGRAFCWGQSESGQLGNGSTATRVTPIAVSGGLTFAAIDAGEFHTCAITHAGAAYCWGLNQSGSLGDGTLNNRLVPVPVAGNHIFSVISAGQRNTCGVTPSNQVYCWGVGFFRALGNGSQADALTPVLVSGGHAFASVSVGLDFACGITTSGQGLCWGSGSNGTLGSGSTAPQGVPGPIAGGLAFASISAGTAHVCGVTTAGAGYCWGAGMFGRLGNGSTLNSLTPAPIAGSLILAQISAGGIHSCAVTTAGTGYCWGGAVDGNLGVASPFTALTPAPVLGGLVWTSIHAGGFIGPTFSSSDVFSFTCGVSVAGQTYCWGSGAHGQLGNGTTGPRGTPTAVAAFP